jgi:uncharacterized membrane protein YhaH (DUF805 family)
MRKRRYRLPILRSMRRPSRRGRTRRVDRSSTNSTPTSDNPYLRSARRAKSSAPRFGDSDAPEVPGFARALRICLVEKYLQFPRPSEPLGILVVYFLWLFIFWVGVFGVSFPLMLLVSPFFVALIFIFSFYILLPTLGAAVRRFHDVGMSGWFVLVFYLVNLALETARSLIEASAVSSGLEGERFFFMTDLSGGSLTLYVLLRLAAFTVQVACIIILCRPGTKGPNKYGPAPWKR